jgi:hypothetical protein
VEGSEEYFDESEHVDGFAAEERSSDGEEVDPHLRSSKLPLKILRTKTELYT